MNRYRRSQRFFTLFRRMLPGALTLCGAFALSACGQSSGGSGTDQLLARYRQTVADSSYIMHALGGMEGIHYYTNSMDAMEANYAAGFRLFEVDVSFTSDDKLVLAHSTNNRWNKNDWEKRLGLPYDESRPLASYDEFLSFTIQGKFRASSLADLLDFMEIHEDVFVMVDGNKRDYADTVRFYSALVDTAAGRTDVLERIIAGGQTTEMIQAAKSVYPFPILNLYFAADKAREDSLFRPEDFIAYCQEEGILSFSIAKETYTPELAAVLGQSGLISYVFTCNDEAQARELFARGADVVGTDFLR